MSQTSAPQPSPLAPLAAQLHRPTRLRRSTAQPHRCRFTNVIRIVLFNTVGALFAGIGVPALAPAI